MTGLGLAPEAVWPVLGLAALSAVTVALAIAIRRWRVWMAGIVLVGLSVGTSFLHRDPHRTAPRDPHLVVAPADGRVVSVTADPARTAGPARRLVIRAGALAVPVHRAPVDGVIDSIGTSGPGSVIRINTGAVRVLVRYPADRPTLRVRESQLVDLGDRTAIDLFGTTVELLLPDAITLRVEPGDRVRAGATVIGAIEGTP